MNVENKLLIKLFEGIVYVVCEKWNYILKFDIGVWIKFLKRIVLEKDKILSGNWGKDIFFCMICG